MNSALFSALHAAVSDRLAVVADHEFRDRDPQAHLAKLKAAAAQLDTLVQSLPGDCDPQLRHFLERQSYAKAVDWLEERRNA
jgi:hypothetical protein